MCLTSDFMELFPPCLLKPMIIILTLDLLNLSETIRQISLPGPPGEQGARGSKGDQPPRIAFTVTRSEPLGPVQQKTPVTFDKIHLNLGDSFDVYSSHFICKVCTSIATCHLSLEVRQNNK